MSLRQHKIAVIAGDGGLKNGSEPDAFPGIGIEVTAAALNVLKAVEARLGTFRLVFDEFDYGSEFHEYGND
jgi:isocitrate/isopropylmalate dehydrogenase